MAKKWQFCIDFEALTKKSSIALGRFTEASMVAIDSQSIKKGPFVSKDTGIDGGKNINGRKRHFAVDLLGLPLIIEVSATNQNDGVFGLEMLWQLEQESKRLELIRAVHAYVGVFQEAANYYHGKSKSFKNPNPQKGLSRKKVAGKSNVLSLGSTFSEGLTKKHEKNTQSAIAFKQIAFVSIIFAILNLYILKHTLKLSVSVFN